MNILFLCTGNSCRSQMAEGWGKQLAPADWIISSAGIQQHGKNPRAIKVMAEAGIDISNQESTRVIDEMLKQADLVVTVCDHADKHCPVLPAGTCKEHWPLDDPAQAGGTEEEILDVFRTTRNELRLRVIDLFDNEITENRVLRHEHTMRNSS